MMIGQDVTLIVDHHARADGMCLRRPWQHAVKKKLIKIERRVFISRIDSGSNIDYARNGALCHIGKRLIKPCLRGGCSANERDKY